MPWYICSTCGVQYAETNRPPDRCAVCEDDRQYVNWDGQSWTTLDDLRRDHRADVRTEEPGLTGLGVEPSFAIGQRALLVQTPAGNAGTQFDPRVVDIFCQMLARKEREAESALAFAGPSPRA